MSETRVVIADDEPLVRLGIRKAVSQIPDITITSECKSGSEVIAAVHSGGIDLLLLDIHMPDYNGLEIVRMIGPNMMPPVIFITAYDEYAVSAFELNAVDYVLKPFDHERLIQSIDRARRRMSELGTDGLMKRLTSLLAGQQPQWTKRISVRTTKGFEIVPVDTIDWISAADNYVEIHCGPRAYLLSETMTNLQARLDPELFARVQRGRIVNISRIRNIAPLVNGTYELALEGGQHVTTGRQYRQVVLEILGASDRQA